jgi:hypothetical protein
MEVGDGLMSSHHVTCVTYEEIGASIRFVGEKPAYLFLADGPRGGGYVASQLESVTEQHRGVCITAGWRNGFTRPFGALLDVIEECAALLQPTSPEILERYAWLLVNVLYPWRRHQIPPPVGELRAGLADVVLRNDQRLIHQFFQRRNVKPQIVSYCMHLLLDAARQMREDAVLARIGDDPGAQIPSGPLVLVLDGAEQVDQLALNTLSLLTRYAAVKQVPVRVCLIGDKNDSRVTSLMSSIDPVMWNAFECYKLPEQRDVASWIHDEAGPQGLYAARLASLFALPFQESAWLAELPDSWRSCGYHVYQTLLSARVLSRTSEGRLRFARGYVQAALYETLASDVSLRMHQRLLEGEEGDDPFAAAWHARELNRRDAGRYDVAAMERAWAVSSYDVAHALADRAFSQATTASGTRVDLLRALLNYEAEQYREADVCFQRAVSATDLKDGEREFIQYLQGYNAIFGLGDYKTGVDLLSTALAYYESKDDKRGAAYIRNSLAFAHCRSNGVDEAIGIEEHNISNITS